MDTTTANIPNYSQYCANRLPCGYCRLMGSMCPLSYQPTITWSPTCGSDQVIANPVCGSIKGAVNLEGNGGSTF